MGRKLRNFTHAKRGRLSKAEKFYITNNPDKISAELMAKELNRPLTQVQNCMAAASETKIAEQKAKEVEKEEVKEAVGNIEKLMGKHIRNGVPIATVMTAAASEAIDSARQPSKMSETLKKSIHKPKG